MQLQKNIHTVYILERKCSRNCTQELEIKKRCQAISKGILYSPITCCWSYRTSFITASCLASALEILKSCFLAEILHRVQINSRKGFNVDFISSGMCIIQIYCYTPFSLEIFSSLAASAFLDLCAAFLCSLKNEIRISL